jgi:probable HAF family extracellular repeat protein
VALGGMAQNCSVEGENPRRGTIAVGQVTRVSFAVRCPAVSTAYRAIDLGTPGGTNSAASGINSAGQVVGWFSEGEECYRAFLWEKGVITDLGTLGGCVSFAAAINSAGQVVGSSQKADGSSRAFLWEKGVMTDLGTLGGENSSASDINSAGQVVGSSQTADGSEHVFLWEKGVMTDLGALGRPTAINSAGKVVGYLTEVFEDDDPQDDEPAGSVSSAFLWENGVKTDLGTLGTGEEGGSAWAVDINSEDQVVGYSDLERGPPERYAFLWEKGVMTNLGSLNGCEGVGSQGIVSSCSVATGINHAGQVVGQSSATSPAGGLEFHAFLWERGTMTDLGTLDGDESGASDINDAGQVVGWSRTQGDYDTRVGRATLWTRE